MIKHAVHCQVSEHGKEGDSQHPVTFTITCSAFGARRSRLSAAETPVLKDHYPLRKEGTTELVAKP